MLLDFVQYGKPSRQFCTDSDDCFVTFTKVAQPKGEVEKKYQKPTFLHRLNKKELLVGGFLRSLKLFTLYGSSVFKILVQK